MKETIRTQEIHIAAARTKKREGDEDTGRRTAGRGEETQGDTRQKNKKKEVGREKKRETNRSPGGDGNMGARLC